MSLPEQELRAMRRAWEFLLGLTSGEIKRVPTAVREEARDIVKHFPLGGDPHALTRYQEMRNNATRRT